MRFLRVPFNFARLSILRSANECGPYCIFFLGEAVIISQACSASMTGCWLLKEPLLFRRQNFQCCLEDKLHPSHWVAIVKMVIRLMLRIYIEQNLSEVSNPTHLLREKRSWRESAKKVEGSKKKKNRTWQILVKKPARPIPTLSWLRWHSEELTEAWFERRKISVNCVWSMNPGKLGIAILCRSTFS